MKKLYTLIILLSITTYTFGQNEIDYAILVKDYNKGNEYLSLIHRKIGGYFNDDPKVHVFDWNESVHSIRQVKMSKEIKRPIGLIKYLDVYVGGIDLDPEINLTTDTSGKTTSVFFAINPSAGRVFKLIDLKTSQIMDYSTYNLSLSSNQFLSSKGRIPVNKFLEEFGGDPAKIKKTNSTQYNKMVEKIKEKYKPIILQNYLEIFQDYASSISNSLGYFGGTFIEKDFEVLRDEESKDEKKLKHIRFNGKRSDSLKVGDDILLYEIVDFESRKSTKFINGFYINEVGDASSTARIAAFGKKKELAELLSSNAELKIFKNHKSVIDYNKRLNKNSLIYNVAVKKDCFFCNAFFEKSLLNVPIVNLMERNAPELRNFQNLAKLEKFIDYDSQELLNKQLGIKYLFYSDAGSMMATDIETGRVVGSGAPQNWRTPGPSIVKNLLMDTFEKNIDLVRNESVSKGKVKEMIVYSDFGFNFGEKIKVMTLIEEKVGSKVLKRKQEIGDGYISKNISDFIAVFKIKDGEKEIFEAQEGKKVLVFEYDLN